MSFTFVNICKINNLALLFPGSFSFSNIQRKYSTATEQKNSEVKGNPEKREFQAETRMLLDIVARSLYSDKEVSSLNFFLLLYSQGILQNSSFISILTVKKTI